VRHGARQTRNIERYRDIQAARTRHIGMQDDVIGYSPGAARNSRAHDNKRLPVVLQEQP